MLQLPGRPLNHANVNQITANLWVGGDLEVRSPSIAATQLDELDNAGITAILDCRMEWSDEDWVTAAKPHLRYHWLGVDDAGQTMPDEWFEMGLRSSSNTSPPETSC